MKRKSAEELAEVRGTIAGVLKPLHPTDRRIVLASLLHTESEDENARLTCEACLADSLPGHARSPWHTCPERKVPG